MKKVLLVAVAALFTLQVFAANPPKLRTIVFADTRDRSIGTGVEKNLAHFNQLTKDIAAALDIDEAYDPFIGTECSKEYLMKWIKTFKCSSNDIVVFCYLGHGARSEKDTSIFPQMCLGSTYESEFVSLEAVKNAIMEKGPRFCLVLADCCNGYGQYVTPKYTLMNASGATTIDVDYQSENMKKLFMMQGGCVIASGSRAGEFSWIDTNPSNKSKAGVFLDAFIENLFRYTKTAGQSCSWKTLMEEVYKGVSKIDITDRDGKQWKQHPVYRVELRRKVDRPDDKVIDDNPGNKLNRELERIADDRNDSYQRIDDIERIKEKYFAKNAMVKVVGRDNSTAIWMGSASEFLSRLSTMARLRKIAILKEEKDSEGKIVLLVVHEIYINKK